MQIVGAAEAVYWAIGHNPAWVATLTQDTSKLALIFLRPQKDDRQSQPHLVLIQHTIGILTQDPPLRTH